MNTYEITLKALSDPTRRALLDRLRVAPCSVTELTEVAQISQPAVSQHLRVLKEAGLVAAQAEGARRIYHLTPDGLLELREYIESFWDEVLGAFQKAAES
ncbi:MAG: metalloregulator ArsR/SmtB family transcription factor [Anaerolineales bacterium]|nr:metalloregulator ArsR/SmtB family transcription factor [Anaerolineales bacterium]